MRAKVGVGLLALALVACGTDTREARDTDVEVEPRDSSAASEPGDAGADAAPEAADAGSRLDGSPDAAPLDPGPNRDAGVRLADGAALEASIVALSDAGCPRDTLACKASCIPAGQGADGCEVLLTEKQVSALALSADRLYVSESQGIFALDLNTRAYAQIGARKISSTDSLAVAGRTLLLEHSFGLNPDLQRYDLDTDEAVTLAQATEGGPLDDIRVHDDYVYYVVGLTPPVLSRVPLAGGAIETFGGVSGYVVEGDTLYAYSGDTLRKRSLSGGASTEVTLAMSWIGDSLFADATHLYTKDVSQFRRVAKAGGSSENVASLRVDTALAISGTDVYFTSSGPTPGVARVRLGAKPTLTVVFEGRTPVAAALAGGFLYLGFGPSAQGSGVLRVPSSP